MATVTLPATLDTYVRQGLATTSYGTSTTLELGGPSSTGGQRNMFFKFDLSSIPAGSTISAATLTIGGAASQTSTYTVKVKVLNGTWTGTTTWNTQPTATTATGQADLTIGSSSTTSSHTLAIPQTIQALVAVGATNNGFSIETTSALSSIKTFKSMENTGVVPSLAITYTAPANVSVNAPGVTPGTATALAGNALPVISVNVDINPMAGAPGTALATMTNGVPVISVNIDINPMAGAPGTAIATSPNAGVTTTRSVNFTEMPATATGSSLDALVSAATTPNASRTNLIVANANKNYAGTTIASSSDLALGTSRAVFLKPDLTGLSTPGVIIVSATLNFDASAAGAVYVVQSVDSDWTDGTAPSPSKGALSLPGGTTTATYGTAGTNSVDITQLVKDWVAGTRTNYGLALNGSAGFANIASRLKVAEDVPTITVAYYSPPIPVEVTADPSTAAGASPDASVSATSTVAYVALPSTATASTPNAGVAATSTVSVTAARMTATALFANADVDATRTTSVGATPATATALATDTETVTTQTVSISPEVADSTAELVTPTVLAEIDPNAGVTATVLEASASMGEGIPTLHITITTEAANAESDMQEGTVMSSNDAVITTQAFRASAILISPEEARNEVFDPYFLRLADQLGLDDNELSYNDYWFRLDETSGTNAENRIGPDGTYHNVTLNTQVGPEGRRAASFNGVDSWIEVPDNDLLTAYSRMEMVFRTTKATQTLATGTDHIFNNFAGYPRKTGLEMFNGVLRLYGRGTAFTGRTRVDDGQWHHIVWTMDNGTTRIYIDGKLEMRRLFTDGVTINAVIDGIGGGPDRLDGQPTVQNAAMYFQGDIMEFVYDKEGYLSPDNATRNFYAAFGVVPVEAGVANAIATAGEATKGKGNQKRALALFYYQDWDTNLDVANHDDQYNWTGLRTAANRTGFIRTSHYGAPVPFDLGGYKVFPKSVIRNEFAEQDAYQSGAYYDEVTGDPRYIDISTDIDASEYDLVFFINTPPRFNYAAGFGNEPSALSRLYEDMVEGVRKVVDLGVSAWVPQPEVAVALGIVSRVEVHSMAREYVSTDDQGNAAGLYDARGAFLDPYIKDPSYGRYYYDTHALNKHRLVAKVDGLTTWPGYIIEDYFYSRPRDPYKVPVEGWKYKEVPNGLSIGDQLYYSQDFYDTLHSAAYLEAYNRRRTVVSVPANAVVTGTVVARENAKHYVGTLEVDNPWRENATTIVVGPGDSLKGRPVGGKIFVDFMEGVDSGMILRRQIVPPNEEITNPADKENSEKRSWDYLSYRVGKIGNVSGGSGSGILLNGGGTAGSAGGDDESGKTIGDYANMLQLLDRIMAGENIISVTEYEKYETEVLPAMTMIDRGFAWLADRQTEEEGDKRVRTPALTATANSPEAMVSTESNATYVAAPAVALAAIVNPDEVFEPNVEIRTLPMTATATMTGYGKTISAGPATAFAELRDNFDMVMVGGEQIVLYLHHEDVNLYILEEE